MSTTSLQNVITRLLFDSDWVKRVYANPDQELAQCRLTPQEIEWILHTDSKRWSIDDQRPYRALEGIVVLCPVSLGCWTSLGGEGKRCLAFFSSSEFHQTIDQHEDLIEGFWIWFTHLLERDETLHEFEKQWVLRFLEYEKAQYRLKRTIERSGWDPLIQNICFSPQNQRIQDTYSQQHALALSVLSECMPSKPHKTDSMGLKVQGKLKKRVKKPSKRNGKKSSKKHLKSVSKSGSHPIQINPHFRLVEGFKNQTQIYQTLLAYFQNHENGLNQALVGLESLRLPTTPQSQTLLIHCTPSFPPKTPQPYLASVHLQSKPLDAFQTLFYTSFASAHTASLQIASTHEASIQLSSHLTLKTLLLGCLKDLSSSVLRSTFDLKSLLSSELEYALKNQLFFIFPLYSPEA